MSAELESVDHLVIGGGLAGSMVAKRLAEAGRRVTLLEKETCAHHKVCGEFLSREAVDYLRQVGVEPLHLGANTIRSVRLSSKQWLIEAALPFPALSLSRHILDEAMLASAAKSGCTVQRGALVESLTAPGNLWIARISGERLMRARTVFLATGKHDLRGWSRKQGRPSDLIGFKSHLRLTPAQTHALRGLIELFLFTGGYGGLSIVEDDIVNLCLVVRGPELRKVGGWAKLLETILDENRHLQSCLQDSKPLWEKPLAISPIPYGYFAGLSDGLWCVGDQAAVIPSFTGDGMAIALHSAALAAQMYLNRETASRYHKLLHAQLGRTMSVAGFVSRMMVTRFGRRLVPLSLALFPNVARWIATSTRIPEEYLLSLQAR